MKTIFAKFLLLILLLSILGMVTSCGLFGPEYHLRKAKYHIALAGELGAEFKKDTIYTNIVVAPGESDTLKSFRDIAKEQGLDTPDPTFMDIIHDTIVNETTKWRVKTVFDTVHKKMYQKVFIKGDTIRVPTEINNSIKAEGIRQYFIWVAVIIGLLIILVIVWRKRSTGKV